MPGLPPFARHLRIFPSRLATDRGVPVAPGECQPTDRLFTFPMLFEALGSLGGSRWASPLASRLILRRLMAGTRGWLGESAADPFAVRAVHRAVAELRVAGVAAGHLTCRPLSDALDPIARLLERYEAALDEAGLADDADRERQAVHAVAHGNLPAALADIQYVTVENGASLFGARLDLLRALAARGIAVQVRLPWDDARPSLFAWPEASLHGIESRGPASIEILFDDRVGDGALRELRGAQQTAQTVSGAPVRVIHAASRAEHARRVALEVAAWLRGGVPADEICVAAGDLEVLGPEIVAELEDAEIPVYLRRGPPVRSSPVGRALASALRLQGSGFPREGLLELWLTLGRSVETPDGPWPAERVAAEVRRAGVRSARLFGYREALEKRAARDASRRAGQGAAAAARAVADALEGLMSGVSDLPERAALGEYVEALEQLVTELDFQKPRLQLDSSDPDGAAPGRRALLRAQAALVAGLEAVRGVFLELRQAARTAIGGPAWTRDEMASLVELLCGEHRLPPAGMRSGSVIVVDIAELPETRFRNLVLAGVDQDVFPRAPPVDLVLTGDVRAEINGLLGPRLLQTGPLAGRDALRGDARDTWLWMEALAACQEELIVTYTTPDGEESGRSDLVDELLRSLGDAEPERLLPSYACATAASLHDVVQQWSVEQLGTGARITAEPTFGHAQALGALLRLDHAERLTAIAGRVAHERRLRVPTGSATPLGEADLDLIREHFFDQVQTTSRLDTLGLCAFRHFASALLGLDTEEVPTLGADAREEGSAAHAALRRVYADLKENGGLRVARRDPAAAKARARRVFDQHTDEILAEVVVHPTLRAATLQDAWQKTETQLDHDLGSDSLLEPVALEYSFSNRLNAEADLLEVRDPISGRVVRVRGQIDRIDCGGGQLLTLDYKRTAKKRVEGRHFQLPLYGLVGLRDFGQGCDRVGAAWVELRSAKRVVAPELDVDPAGFERCFHEAFWPRIHRVVGGDVSPDPDAPETCKRCDFGRLCRFDANRAAAAEDA